MNAPLNFRHVHNGQSGIFTFFTKRAADAAAKAAGWRVSDVSLAANRFGEFWVICQQIDSETIRVVGHGGPVDIPFQAAPNRMITTDGSS